LRPLPGSRLRKEHSQHPDVRFAYWSLARQLPQNRVPTEKSSRKEDSHENRKCKVFLFLLFYLPCSPLPRSSVSSSSNGPSRASPACIQKGQAMTDSLIA